ncbi:chorismate mutase [Aurantiacibacter spongiae]|uniref:chorismate mutase n=1 Tax=Aurantiacibacter spongiae TaxID=2488860 RepID=A0A3N5DEZ4_9SPHN|nr:chorismate mutase [Aurantiacibacter spongiae]RPF70212.1 chorismate mutase [Aurantiacibacter spongiae]
MTTRITMPDDCETMTEVREGVDQTDRDLLALLERRYGYMRAAARIKQDRGTVRDERRKAQVIEAMRDGAARAGLPAHDIAGLWDMLVESSIAYELAAWDRLRR